MHQQTARKTCQEKLRPTPAQERALEDVLWHCRTLYNTALEQRITAYQRRRVSVSRFQQEAELKELRAASPEYAAIHSHVFQDVLARLDKTYHAFFRRLQHGEKAGFPRFKGRHRFHAFPLSEFGNGATVDDGFLVLSKIGRIRVHWSRPRAGTPKTVTSSKEADGWSVAISCAEVPTPPLPTTGQETGIDRGLESFATRSDGSRILTPRRYRKAEASLAKRQRRVARRKKGSARRKKGSARRKKGSARRKKGSARRKKGSARRKKAVVVLAKAHQTVRRQRQDFHHKTALSLVRASDTISHEDVRVANLVRNHHLAKSIADAGWSAFLAILTFKAASAGKRVQAVDPAYTSQACSGCGVVVSKGLSVRWHSWPDCGTSLHRDHNAAKNREGRGQRLRGEAGGLASQNREPAAN
jgi:putative transposase